MFECSDRHWKTKITWSGNCGEIDRQKEKRERDIEIERKAVIGRRCIFTCLKYFTVQIKLPKIPLSLLKCFIVAYIVIQSFVLTHSDRISQSTFVLPVKIPMDTMFPSLSTPNTKSLSRPVYSPTYQLSSIQRANLLYLLLVYYIYYTCSSSAMYVSIFNATFSFI